MRRPIGLAALVPLIFLTDRIFKIFILQNIPEGESLPLIPGFLHLTRVNNTGAAFGILRGSGGFLTAVSVMVIVLLSGLLLHNLTASGKPGPSVHTMDFASPFIIAGAMGNLYDRIRYGYVIDFLDFRFWPVFNLADASICLGVFLIVFYFLKGRLVRNGRA